MRVSTILTPERIRLLLAERYGLADVSGSWELPGASTGHVWKVETASGAAYVLKEFAPAFSLERVSQEPGLVGHLRAQGMPVAEFYPTTVGEYTWLLEGRPLSLQSVLPGFSTEQCQAAPWLLRDSVRLLGRLHAAAADYPCLPARFDGPWLAKRYDTARRQERMNTLISLAENEVDEALRQKILDDMVWRLSRLESANRLRFDPAAFTLGNTHGDYNVANILTQGKQISGVIDFSNSCSMPVAWEVFRSYTLGAPECAEARIDINGLRQYFAWYMESAPLKKYDLRMVAKLTYFHIVHSQFGYSEYLEDHAENWQALIGYASWQVDLAKWLEGNMAGIEEALVGLAG